MYGVKMKPVVLTTYQVYDPPAGNSKIAAFSSDPRKACGPEVFLGSVLRHVPWCRGRAHVNRNAG